MNIHFFSSKDVRELMYTLDTLPYKIRFGPLYVCICGIIVITTIRFLLDPFIGNNIPLALYIFPIMVSAWYYGLIGGFAVTITSVLIGDYLFIYPKYDLGIVNTVNILLIFIFFAVSFLFSTISIIGRAFLIQTRKLSEAEEDARVASQKALEYRDNFLSFASHELKTPLTSALLYIQLLEKTLKKDHGTSYDYDLRKIKMQVEKIQTLTNQLLDVSHISGGMITLHYTKFDLTKVTNEAIRLVKLVETQHRISIEGKKNILMKADEEKLRQCLINIISNAIKYSPESKRIIINLSVKKQIITIAITDFGMGIPKEERINIFKQFYRSKKSYTFPGTGMGLYYVKEIIKRHNGTISVVSEVNKGSTFTITLPQ